MYLTRCILPFIFMLTFTLCQKQSQNTPPEKIAQPTITPAAAIPEKVDTIPKVLRIMEEAFAKNNKTCTAELQKILVKTDATTYNEFLRSLKATNDSDYTIDTSMFEPYLTAYKAATDYAQIEESLRLIKKAVPDSIDNKNKILSGIEKLTVTVDSKGIFRSGLLLDTNFTDVSELRITSPVDGCILLLNPQMVYKWPGKKESASFILQPTAGPYKVVAAVTFYPKVTTHCQEWKKGRVQASKYLGLTNKTDLLIKDSSGNEGWISMDSVAFLDKTFEKPLNKGMKELYLKGYAWYLHGVWIGEDVLEPYDFDDINSKDVFIRKGDITHINLLRMEWGFGNALDLRNEPVMYDNFYYNYGSDPDITESSQGMGFNLIYSLKLVTEKGPYIDVTFLNTVSMVSSMELFIYMENELDIHFARGKHKYTINDFYRGN